MTARSLFFSATVIVLITTAAWLLRPGDRGDHGVALEPSALTLRPGEEQIIELVNNEADVVALAFSLRFDDAIVAVDSPRATQPSILAGGVGIELPVNHRPGTLRFPGIAVTGGRTFDPGSPVYRFTVRALAPGTATLAVEDPDVVDLHGIRHHLPLATARVTVAGAP